ncbi:MAG TPA: hypothetical protein VLX58_10050 [Bryobacteraceae bacterium]|nr:hypothetical protein [Bryobacteraceae bacterium]
MKKLALLTAAASMLSVAAFADTLNGTLIDVMCKDKDAAGHTRKCALGCAKSGFGLVTSDGKFLKFDEAGNAKALAALKASDKEKDIKAKVEGTVDGDTVQVSSVEIE